MTPTQSPIATPVQQVALSAYKRASIDHVRKMRAIEQCEIETHDNEGLLFRYEFDSILDFDNH